MLSYKIFVVQKMCGKSRKAQARFGQELVFFHNLRTDLKKVLCHRANEMVNSRQKENIFEALIP